MNIVGRLRNNNYQDAEGEDVYGLGFTVDEIDYLDSKAEAEARRSREAGPDTAVPSEARSAPPSRPRKANGRVRKAAHPDGEVHQAAL